MENMLDIIILTYYVCLFCSHIGVSIMRFFAFVIQLRGPAINPGIIHHILHEKISVPNQEYDSYYPFF